MVYMYHSFLIHSSADGHLGCFHVLAMINSAVMNTGVHMSLSDLVSSVCMPRSGIDKYFLQQTSPPVFCLVLNLFIFLFFLKFNFLLQKFSNFFQRLKKKNFFQFHPILFHLFLISPWIIYKQIPVIIKLHLQIFEQVSLKVKDSYLKINIS